MFLGHNKASGPDDFPAEFYQFFGKLLNWTFSNYSVLYSFDNLSCSV
jgi:hypothetical protein